MRVTGLGRDQVLAAIHQQRLAKRTIPDRVSQLELEVRELSAAVRQLLERQGRR